jgi:hypothetical protein
LSGARTTTSSSVFHSPHSGHLPLQRNWAAPQLEQTNCFFSLPLSLAAGMFGSDQSNITFLRESHRLDDILSEDGGRVKPSRVTFLMRF